MTETDVKYIKSFLAGTSHTSYDYFGAHELGDRFVFRVFAPKATSVILTGDFNGWKDDIFLKKIDDSGVWQTELPSDMIFHGNRYKYRIYGCGQLYYKSDPYAQSISKIPDSSSVIRKKEEYSWKDGSWLAYRAKYQKSISAKPLNLYDVHLGSWKNNGRGGALNYKEYARELAPYVKQMGYTHVSLLPINEFFEGDKINYVPRGLFAPTSKYGTPDDLKAFVDKLHEAGVGVIFDIPIVSFLKEKYKLFDCSGGMFYGHIDNERIRHFDLTQGSVRSLLLSSVSYWIREFHADAIRISDSDELLSFYHNENSENNAAYDFLVSLIKTIKKNYPDVLLVASGRVGGNLSRLGFDLVFDEFISKILHEYSSVDFTQRGAKSPDAFGLIEQSSVGTLSIGYDDPIYKRKTLIDAMAGDYWQKFAGLRTLWGLLMTARGKKLSFMGNEIAQFNSWGFEKELEWFLLDFESHEKFQRYIAELNNFYLAHSALWQNDVKAESFCFVDRATFNQNVMIFRRSSRTEELTVVVNFAPVAYEEFRIGAHTEGTFKELFNSDDINYYGSGVVNKNEIETQPIEYHGCKSSFVMRVPPLAVSVLSFKKKTKNKK